MPRNGSGVYSAPAGTLATTLTTIKSPEYNAFVNDLVSDANAARPIVAGGTGGTSKQGAIDSIFDGTAVIDDSDLRISDPADRSKIVRLDAGQITTATVRVMNAPDRDINISAVSKGYLYGLTLSNNATDATNDIDIAAGEAADEGATPWIMVLASALTKRLDAAWAVGSGNGGLDTGSIANGTYHVWLIQRSDTGVVDALFSASATSPTMPTNYDRKRRIGSIIRASAAILAFSQLDDEFLLKTSIRDIIDTTLGATAKLYALSVPLGIQVRALIGVNMTNAANGQAVIITSPDENDQAAAAGIIDMVNSGAAGFGDTNVVRRTNTSAQVRARATSASTTISGRTYGWIDTRGRL